MKLFDNDFPFLDMLVEYIGYLAAICTTVAFLPQAILVWKTKNTASISFAMYTIFTFGVVMWTVYGYMTHQLPILLANMVTTVLAFSIWWMKVTNIRQGKEK